MKKILILSANPTNTDRLRLDQEVREIQTGLERARNREQFEIITRWAVRPDDLRRSLLDHEPQIVHFSGHGAGDQGLVLENEAGEWRLVSTEALADLFGLFKDKVECVLLNACYSEVQAEAIYQHIGCVMGMNQIAQDRMTLEQLQQIAPTEAGPYNDHLRRHLLNLQDDEQLLAALKQVVTVDHPVDVGTTAAFKLRSMGLVKFEGNKVMSLCNLYSKYFSDRLGLNK